MNGFRSASDRLREMAEFGHEKHTSQIRFGISFLDDAFGGLYPDDMVIMTARTGAGKTELATQLAYTNAIRGHKVHLFALEAYKAEIETRLLFRSLSSEFFQNKSLTTPGEVPNFQDWVCNKQEHILASFNQNASDKLKEKLSTLYTYYREDQFDVETFESQLARIAIETELVVCDHLHYFDLESTDENRELKRTVKKIRDLTMFYRKPTVLVAHIRKQDKRFQTLIPDLEDIYGSSDISKIATKIFAVAPAKDISQNANEPHIFPTYIRILKNRLDGSRTYYAAICKFNIQRNAYEDEYCIGKIQNDGSFEETNQVPKWAKHHRSFLSGNIKGSPRAGYNPSDW